MERQIIRINSNKEVERIVPVANGDHIKRTVTIDSFFSMWLKNITVYHRVDDFKITDPNSITISFLSIGDFSLEEIDIQIEIEESATNNPLFMEYMYHLESIFNTDKEFYQREYRKLLEEKTHEVAFANACVQILKKCCNGELIEDLNSYGNPNDILTYFRTHQEVLKDNEDIILSNKQKMIRCINFKLLLIFFFTFMLSLVVGFPLTLFTHSKIVAIATTTIMLPSLFAEIMCIVIYSSTREFLNVAIERFTRLFDELCDSKDNKDKTRDFEDIMYLAKKYIKISGYHFPNEEAELEVLVSSISKENEFDQKRRLEEVKRYLEIEYRIFNKGLLAKVKVDATYTSYIEDHISNILYYIGIDEESIEYGVPLSLLEACKKLLSEPFYGYELEITRLLIALVSYLEKSKTDDDVSVQSYLALAVAALKKQRETIRLDTLKSARDDLAKVWVSIDPEEPSVLVDSKTSSIKMHPTTDK